MRSTYTLFACGSNGQGQLGVGHDEDLSNWTPVALSLSGPISVAGGGNHTVIIEHEAGRSYISKNNIFVPIEHPSGAKWKLCSAGWAFTVLVDEKNCIWVSGSGLKGELGIGQETYADLKPINWEPPADIVSVKSGMAHTVICLWDGSLWGWGASRKGQLNCMMSIVDRPILVMNGAAAHSTAQSYACGRDFTAILYNGRLEILGNMRCFESRSINACNNRNVLAGWSTVVLLPSGRALGNNSHGQLDAPPNPEAVTLGSEHGLYRVGSSTVKTWGWGEHGNCPPDHKFEGIVTLFAGCATSFVYCTLNN